MTSSIGTVNMLLKLSEAAPTGYKLNGEPTWLQIPKEIPLMAPFDQSCLGPVNLEDPTDIRAVFYQLLAEYGMKTFAYHIHVAAQLNFMIEQYPTELMELAVEVFPDERNTRLGRAHGKINQYQTGCRGPLCRLANREQTRARSGGSLPKDPALENAMAWMRLSYLQYLQYAKMLRYTRRVAEQKPGFSGERKWQNITLVQTILMDCTNETELHQLTVSHSEE